VLFEVLQNRLVTAVRMRVRGGELTERRLARLIGLSQPHLHNVLKGVRSLSPEVADRILRELKISLLDLCDAAELSAHLSASSPGDSSCREVPVLEGWLGPGHRFPAVLSSAERYPFPARQLRALTRPVVAVLAGDPAMASALSERDLVLLDLSEQRRTDIDAGSFYAVEFEGQGLIRWVRLGARCIYLVSADSFTNPAQWVQVPLTGWHILEVVKARVVWIARSLG
jgi:transcriptional regulator with XRE-family HTH domain